MIEVNSSNSKSEKQYVLFSKKLNNISDPNNILDY
jgi:hypothetical protein